ncbi:hypothetical protein M2323_004032 [Rhodoblastus acidophilus]|uniref:hypothetical protein n=1 Tax=Rhodoblastus acidophilus TaxID=1074 RepID=UPI002224415D|nr:hypothetical protein [Rhodoblastus acidophilus]MCW2286229.1 hypothetical protein [Rhodoblastus acidophilus]MCW2335088.1 hypothetical protein [Rhodoblastus acidophilus]
MQIVRFRGSAHMLAAAFRNAAPRFPEKVSVYLPKGARAAIERAAEQTGVTAPELLRLAIVEKIRPAEGGEDCGRNDPAPRPSRPSL